MKKIYSKPVATIVEMSFDEHIAASGGQNPHQCIHQYNYASASCNIYQGTVGPYA
ncbi:MAG: hypothetical protein ACOX0U_06285 [Oscillospiraceae bacterium]|jgi:hypothetical protein